MKKRYNKLVRDKIPGLIKDKGKEVKCHKATVAEFMDKLVLKILEEASEVAQASAHCDIVSGKPDVSDEEFDKAKTDVIEELADLEEVLDVVKKWFDITDDRVLMMKEQKRREKGSFDTHTILDWTK